LRHKHFWHIKDSATYNIIVLSLSLNLTVSIKLASDVPEAHHEQFLFNAKWLQHLGDNICANAFYYVLFPGTQIL